jgi:hypothetical protein
MYQDIVDAYQLLGRPVRPHHSEPGTAEEQWRAMFCSWRLADKRGTSADKQYGVARRLVMPHASPNWKPEVRHVNQ